MNAALKLYYMSNYPPPYDKRGRVTLANMT